MKEKVEEAEKSDFFRLPNALPTNSPPFIIFLISYLNYINLVSIFLIYV